MSRTRREKVASSLFDQQSGRVHMPNLRKLGLMFDSGDCAVAIMESLLNSVGMSDPEQLRLRFALPTQSLLAAPIAGSGGRKSLIAISKEEALEEALWLGLCTAYLFDPGRPIVWTETSLRRSFNLCEPSGFYV